MHSVPPVADAPTAAGARRLNQGITATWWYTASAIVVFQALVVLIWLTPLQSMGADPAVIAAIAGGGLIWCAASIPLLRQYRHRDDSAGPIAGWRGAAIPLVIAIAYGALCGIVSGQWMLGFLPLVQTLALLNWPRGIRIRLLLLAVVVIAALWFIDSRTLTATDSVDAGALWMTGVFSVTLPTVTVMSLWWWDVLVTLNRARASEARLAATQERLRVATDVHDLQGHHLQVIALQLELAERLLDKDPDAAAEQLRLARSSVADAQQGTRELATRFRGVPLPDEIANAVDLLRAAGTTADASVADDAAQAPASVLGPVIRETTTNVLRHGGGKWARLSLHRQGRTWRYEIANDAGAESPRGGAGSGLDGITRRTKDEGGEVRIERVRGGFHVIVTVPDSPVVPDAVAEVAAR